MSCVISSAICCVLMTSSVSGVALGYNYSLAEFIEAKETNVSVFVKRGIFDDDAKEDDSDWRRSGHNSIRGLVRDEGNVITMEPETKESSLRSGRRLDDSIMESDDKNKFEGSLMRLTAKLPVPFTTTPSVTSDRKMEEIVSQYPRGSFDQLKAIQALISMRKAEAARDTTVNGMDKSTYPMDDRYIANIPEFPPDSIRRMMNAPPRTPHPGYPGANSNSDLNPARFAVPDSSINEPAKWMGRKRPEAFRKSMNYEDPGSPVTYPRPIIFNTGPRRPTRPTDVMPSHTPMVKQEPVTVNVVELPQEKPVDLGLDEFKEKLILDRYETHRVKPDSKKKTQTDLKKNMMDYYDEDIKGLPVRRKRSTNIIKIKLKKRWTGHDRVHAGKGEENTHISNYNTIFFRKFLDLNTATVQ